MKDISDEIVEIEYKNLNDLKLKYDKKMGLTVWWNDVKYEFLINLKENSEKLIILGSGALGFRQIDRSKPYINRHSWEFKYSTIYYNDPTYYIDDSITGGWGIGTSDNYYLENIAVILQHLINKLNMPNKNVFFYGSSAGGFISIMLATIIKDTTALADIPQIFIYNYKSKDKQIEVWRDVKIKAFDNISDKEFIENYKYRLDIIEMMKRENYIPNAYLFMDCSVDLDFKTQYLPFFNRLNEIPFNEDSNKIKLITYGRNIGHVPFSKEETFDLIYDLMGEEYPENYFIKTVDENLVNQRNLKLKNKIINNIKKYNTARIDLIFEGLNNKINLLSIDDFVDILKPSWFNTDEKSGMIIKNRNNSVDFEVKCEGDGEYLTLLCRGEDFRGDDKKRLPIYINYKKIIVNDEVILDGNKYAWHNDPIKYNHKVEQGEIIKVHIEWEPC